MKALRNILLSLSLLVGVVLIWDFLPFYASADSITPDSPPNLQGEETDVAQAVFAGGCFWCMEKPFDQLPGVLATTSGYTGGDVENPSYYQVSAGTTGHLEAIQITYDPTQITYPELLEVFWQNIDPLDARGQFCDKGSQYRSAIFVQNEAERAAAEQSKQAMADKPSINGDIATEILPAQTFYGAEDYHQDYYLKHPVRYKVYRFGCGRDQRLAELWGPQTH